MAEQGRDGIVCHSPIECNHRDTEQVLMIEEGVPQTMLIDPSRARFPCCIVWTPLPVLSWFIPFIGHMGICREDGVILDFAGPNFVCTDNFAFGTVARYIQINKEKCEEGARYDRDKLGGVEMTWDDALRKSTQEFQHRSYNLLTCNCHSFVANALNRLHFRASQWNVVNLAALILLKGRWVSRGSAARSFLPFFIVLILGLTFGGWTFVEFLTGFCFLIVGWFLLGTYCFKSLIHL